VVVNPGSTLPQGRTARRVAVAQQRARGRSAPPPRGRRQASLPPPRPAPRWRPARAHRRRRAAFAADARSARRRQAAADPASRRQGGSSFGTGCASFSPGRARRTVADPSAALFSMIRQLRHAPRMSSAASTRPRGAFGLHTTTAPPRGEQPGACLRGMPGCRAPADAPAAGRRGAAGRRMARGRAAGAARRAAAGTGPDLVRSSSVAGPARRCRAAARAPALGGRELRSASPPASVSTRLAGARPSPTLAARFSAGRLASPAGRW